MPSASNARHSTRTRTDETPGTDPSSSTAPRATAALARFFRTPTVRTASLCALVFALGTAIAWLLGAPFWTQPHVDLEVYLRGGNHVLDGRDDLYATDPGRLPFTYPPFAATLFALLALLHEEWASAVLTLLSLGSLGLLAMLWTRLALPKGITFPASLTGHQHEKDLQSEADPVPGRFAATGNATPSPNAPDATPNLVTSRLLSWSLVAGIAFLASLPLQPTLRTFDLGQINLILTATIVTGITLSLRANSFGRSRTRAAASRGRASARPWIGGILLGIATGFKLTPAVFVAWLFLTRRWKAFAGAVGGTLATMLVGAFVLPHSSWEYWTHTVFNTNRIGGLFYAGNQSINGAIWRALGPDPSSAYWAIALVLMLGFSTWLASRTYRRKHFDLSVLTVALFGLLVSPVSWDHHWVWQTAIVVSLVRILTDGQYDRPIRICTATLSAVWIFASYAKMIWWFPHVDGQEYSVIIFGKILTNAYPILGLATLALFVAVSRKPSRSNSTYEP